MADVANVSTSAAALYVPNARSVAATEHTVATLAVTVKLALAVAARAGVPTSPNRPANTSRAAAWQQRWSENGIVWKAIWWSQRRAILGLGFHLPGLEGAASVVCESWRISGAPVEGAGQKSHGARTTTYRSDSALPFTW